MSGRCVLGMVLVLLASASARAYDPPPDLPHYDLHVTLDTQHHQVHLKQRVTWTNRHARPATELVFCVYPLYKMPDKDVPLLAKTVEILRATPSDSLITDSAGSLPKARLPDGTVLPVMQKTDNMTAVVVPLPAAVGQGQSVTVELEYDLKLPNKQGRWGHWNDVTFLANWSPQLAFYDEKGWQPPPFIPWHQPFFHEAGVYNATVVVPNGHVLAAGMPIASERDRGDGWTEIVLSTTILRDFALVASPRFHVIEGDAAGVKVRIVYLPEHKDYAQAALKVTCEAIPVYARWFGPYPYPQFTVCESFFPWNGNECAGIVLLDHRVFMLPQIASGYFDYLLTHEIAHQWWYNLVGTNGYAEPFMDEAPATYFSHRLMDKKVGRNNDMIKYPSGLGWLPNIRRENYRYSTWLGAVRRGEAGPAAQPIDAYSHVYDLFSGAYDRGSRIFMLLEDRLGEAAYFDFIRLIVKKYAFRVLRVADFQRELEAFTGRPWDDFFREWVNGRGLVDWKVDDVKTSPQGGGTQVEVTLVQRREIDEPTVVGFKMPGAEGYAVRIPVNLAAGPMKLENPPADVTPLGDHKVLVRVQLPSAPEQVSVDPDAVLADAEPANNHWHTPVRYRWTPLYLQLDDADLVNDYDRWTVQAGPYIYATGTREPWYARSTLIGLRAGVIKPQDFVGGTFLAYRNDYRDIVAGVDGFFDHFPWPKTQAGFHIEKRIAGPIGQDGPNDVTRAVLYGRYVQQYSSALYLNPMKYTEVFGTYFENAMDFAKRPPPGSIRFDHATLAGIHYSVNYLTPYWDPEAGFRFDATYSGGTVDLDRVRPTQRVESQLTYVKTPPSWLGPLANTRLAIRVAGAAGWPNEGLYYALGGSTLFRGFDLGDRQGSAFWVGNLEWRVPLVRHVEWDVCDHLAGLRGIYAAAFYDIGAAYSSGRRVEDVAHCVGIGLRWDVAWFSFIERSMIRLDVGKTLNDSTPVQVWVGMLHAF